MNLSGGSVLAARDFYKIADEDLLIVSDDLNLPLGKLRFRPSGSSGGQKGWRTSFAGWGPTQVPRLANRHRQPARRARRARISCWENSPKRELPEIEVAIMRAADAVEVWAREGLAISMNRYN